MSSFTNPLCVAGECHAGFGCAHRGPKGEMCHFEVEKKLCSFLDKPWRQELTIDSLLEDVGQRLIGYSEPQPELTAERLAETFKPGGIVPVYDYGSKDKD